MIRLTFAQMRRSIGRLSAAGIAIAIGTAFIVVTLLAGSVISRTTYDSISAQFGKADLVLSGVETLATDDYGDATREGGVPLTAEQIETITNTEGVEAVQPQDQRFISVSSTGTNDYQMVIPASESEKLNPLETLEGRFPSAVGEIAIPADFAQRADVGLNDPLTAEFTTYPDEFGGEPDVVDDSATGAGKDPIAEDPTVIEVPLTVVGLLEDPNSAFAMYGGASVVSADQLAEFTELKGSTDLTTQVAVALNPGTSAKETIASLDTALNSSGSSAVKVQTRDDAAAEIAKAFTGGEDILTNIVLAFAGLALLVAGLVIANTFQVLVAQRTKTLAMMRCVGASKGQLRQSVLIEAGVLGLGASLVGILLGSGIGQLALTILGRFDLQVPLPSTITMTPIVWILPILAGVTVTMIAALSPARAATRVSPLAAMRPAETPSIRSGGTVRLVFALLFAVGGFALLAAGVLLAKADEPTIGLLAGLLGGAVSFIGVIVGAVFWIPGVTRLIGRFVSLTGPSGKLAAANTVRNPRRTAATSTALLIGVTLVVMMSTGAISARHTLNQGLDEQFPVDAWAQSFNDSPGSFGWTGDGQAITGEPVLTPAVRSQVEVIDGVQATLPLLSTLAETGAEGSWPVYGLDPAAGASVVRDPAMLRGLDDTTILLGETVAQDFGIVEGSQVELTYPTQEMVTAGNDPTTISLTAVIAPLQLEAPVITATNLTELNPEARTSDLWIALGPDADAYAAVSELQDLFGSEAVWVTGAAVERAMFQQVIDTLLAIVVGLLGVAVVIALIGVANTLSLSVIERQRENAMLRAVGLSRKQLRMTLAIEGILIATVGTGLGVLLGLIYGWAGSLTVLVAMGDVALAVPWRDLGIVLVVALVAGLLASVLPARRAARTSPVEALAVD